MSQLNVGQILLPTASVNNVFERDIKKHCCSIILDSSSQPIFIIKSLRNRLNVARTPCYFSVNEIGGSSSSIQLLLTFVLMFIDRITENTPNKRSAIPKYLHLADPDF